MDEHLRFCKRTYKNSNPDRPRTHDAGPLNFVHRISDDPEPGDAYYDTESEQVFVFHEDNWIQMVGPGNADV